MTRDQWRSVARAHEKRIAVLTRELDRANTKLAVCESYLPIAWGMVQEYRNDAAVRMAANKKRKVAR